MHRCISNIPRRSSVEGCAIINRLNDVREPWISTRARYPETTEADLLLDLDITVILITLSRRTAICLSVAEV